MTVIRAFIVVLITGLLSACGTTYKAPIADRSKVPGNYHRVHRGETVYSIAWLYGLDYRELARWNGISRSYAIYPGQKLRLKQSTRKKIVAKKYTRPVIKRTVSKPVSKPAKPTRTKKAPSISKPSKKKKPVTTFSHWLWPTKGKIIRGFSGNDSGKKGIAISGRSGQRVIASAPGKVVYSGEGLLRYGKLIIIKHNDTFLSAYAHNRRLLVKEGSIVRQGQPIAEMGNSGTDRTMLHFEIRKNGKPVNPAKFLSKR